MKDLLEYIVKNLVSKPEDVQIEEETSDDGVTLYLTVNPEDMGMVIGKSGQTIRAIRKLLITRAMAEDLRVNLNLVEQKNNTSGEDKEEVAEESDTESDEKQPASQD